jgi:hypothetical protein
MVKFLTGQGERVHQLAGHFWFALVICFLSFFKLFMNYSAISGPGGTAAFTK